MPGHRGDREGEGHHRGIGVAREYEFRPVSPLEEVEKAKTTINNMVMYYHDEVHEEGVVQLPCLGDGAHPESLQGQDVHSSGIRQLNVAINGEKR